MKRINEWLAARPGIRVALLTIYYLGIIAALIALYGRGDFSTPAFVYQEF
ncbi:MAG: teichoic acid D-Ala incorporation-associated protein DltX [Chthoniobacteraceae bacterium]